MIKSFFRWVIATNLAVGLLPAAPAPGGDLLERASERVKVFWDQFSAVTCLEELLQEKFNEKGKLTLKNQSKYDYLILMSWDKGDLLVDESRVEIDAPRKGRPAGSLLATRGFATLLFILHPEFRDSYSFSLPIRDPESNLMRIEFLPRSGTRSPGVMELKGREYPIPWAGSAWIDPETAAVMRIEAAWKEPPESLGLSELESDVRYGPVAFGRGEPYWLPQTAEIELKTPHQRWHNLHRFTSYRRFSVDVRDEVGGAQPVEPSDGGTK